jgi:hypothetical protein
MTWSVRIEIKDEQSERKANEYQALMQMEYANGGSKRLGNVCEKATIIARDHDDKDKEGGQGN